MVIDMQPTDKTSLLHVVSHKGIQDSGFHVLDSVFLKEIEFWTPIVSGIAESLSCIPDSKVQDSIIPIPL